MPANFKRLSPLVTRPLHHHAQAGSSLGRVSYIEHHTEEGHRALQGGEPPDPQHGHLPAFQRAEGRFFLRHLCPAFPLGRRQQGCPGVVSGPRRQTGAGISTPRQR